MKKEFITSSRYKFQKGDTRFARVNNSVWRTETVNAILTDMVYCGHMENHKYEVSNYKTKKLVRVPDNEHIIVRNTHEVIISEEETGFFWCNSRYYNPEWGRWLTPDSIEYLDPQSINVLNLYCYCFNDPVNYSTLMDIWQLLSV